MEISTDFLTEYLLERDYNWEQFEVLSRMAAHKKEVITAQWRFGETIELEDVEKIFKVFKLPINDFLRAYKSKHEDD